MSSDLEGHRSPCTPRPLILLQLLEFVFALVIMMLSLVAYSGGLAHGWYATSTGGLILLIVPVEVYLEYVEAARFRQWMFMVTNTTLFALCIVVIGTTMPVLDADDAFSGKAPVAINYWNGLVVLCILEATLLLVDITTRAYGIWIAKKRSNLSGDTTQTMAAHSLNRSQAISDPESQSRHPRDTTQETQPRPTRQPYSRLRDYSPGVPAQHRKVMFAEDRPQRQPSLDNRAESFTQSESSSRNVQNASWAIKDFPIRPTTKSTSENPSNPSKARAERRRVDGAEAIELKSIGQPPVFDRGQHPLRMNPYNPSSLSLVQSSQEGYDDR